MSDDLAQQIRWHFTADAVHGNTTDHDLTLCGLEIEPQSEIVKPASAPPPEVCDICRCILQVGRRLEGVRIRAIEILALTGKVVHAIRENDGSPEAPWLRCSDRDIGMLVLRVETEAIGARFFNFDAQPLDGLKICPRCFPANKP